ncbi:hypothetical protein Hdeb2414_s0008g00285251 [Helianthus debilis subsp. tardiflorus]
MKIRNQVKRKNQSTNRLVKMKWVGILLHITQKQMDGVHKFLKQAGSRRSRGSKKQDNHPLSWDDADKLKEKEKQVTDGSYAQNISEVKDSKNSSPSNKNDGSPQQAKSELEYVMADSNWEDGSNPYLNSENNHPGYINKDITIELKDITIEFDSLPGTVKRKPIRQASAEEKVNVKIFLVKNIVNFKSSFGQDASSAALKTGLLNYVRKEIFKALVYSQNNHQRVPWLQHTVFRCS